MITCAFTFLLKSTMSYCLHSILKQILEKRMDGSKKSCFFIFPGTWPLARWSLLSAALAKLRLPVYDLVWSRHWHSSEEECWNENLCWGWLSLLTHVTGASLIADLTWNNTKRNKIMLIITMIIKFNPVWNRTHSLKLHNSAQESMSLYQLMELTYVFHWGDDLDSF